MKTATIFGDHMVLQRDRSVPVWGEAAPGERVTVLLQGQEATATADENGSWKLTLEPLQVSGDETMTVTGAHETLTFTHVAVGEVWLAGGQSNMEFHMRYDKDFAQAVAVCENPLIRFFDYPELAYEGAEQDYDFSNFGFWRPCDPDNLQWFSAVAYYFARDLNAALGVPVGILGCNLGGSRAVCWMDETTAESCAKVWLKEYAEGLKAIPDLDAWFENYKKDPVNDHSHPFDNPLMDRMMYGVSAEEMRGIISAVFGGDGTPTMALQIGPCHEWRPCGLYHTMLEHVAPYGIRGFLWYQGESDAPHADAYEAVLSAMIRRWRALWSSEDLPFLQTQLAPLSETSDPSAADYPAIRRVQQRLAETMENVWCTNAGDVGSFHDIHPKEKQPIGHRMALLARCHVYGETGLLCEAPVAASCAFRDGELTVRFRNGDGLRRSSGDALPLTVTAAGQSFDMSKGLETEVVDDTLRIRSRVCDLSNWEAVSMGETPWYVMNLVNAADIPAMPFTLVNQEAAQ